MPFDALVRSPETLTDVLVHLGITPVPPEVLAEHKRTEQAKYPAPSRLYPYLGVLRVGIGLLAIVSLMTGIIGVIGFGLHAAMNMWLLGFTLIAMPVVMYGSTRVVRGPAEWMEHTPSFRHTEVPESILSIAVRVVALIPGARIVIGELRQDSILLDPYLVVRTRSEEVCLGIWKGRNILHQATRN